MLLFLLDWVFYWFFGGGGGGDFTFVFFSCRVAAGRNPSVRSSQSSCSLSSSKHQLFMVCPEIATRIHTCAAKDTLVL